MLFTLSSLLPSFLEMQVVELESEFGKDFQLVIKDITAFELNLKDAIDMQEERGNKLYKVPIGRAIFVLSFKGDLTRHDLLNVKESFKNT